MDEKGNFYFMEMNTRLQVEHPVTEMVYSIDLVKEQLRIASGELLKYSADSIVPRGWAIECRINAEDVYSDFMPTPGEANDLRIPGGPFIRVDTHLYNGYVTPPYYDSLLAKLVAWGRGRNEAISRMRRALDEFHIKGTKTTIPFHKQLVSHPLFIKGDDYSELLDKILSRQKRVSDL